MEFNSTIIFDGIPLFQTFKLTWHNSDKKWIDRAKLLKIDQYNIEL